MATKRVGVTWQDRFWMKVRRGSDDECWPWQAAFSAKGYGLFRLDGKTRKAHRIAWALGNSVAPTALGPDIEIHHTCENNDCCNFHHLHAIDSNTHDRIHARDLSRAVKRGSRR